MTILVHRNVNVASLLDIYNEGLEPEDQYDAATVLCLDHMGEAWDDWPEGCNTELVCYIGHKTYTRYVADVYLRIAPASPAWNIEAYLAMFPQCEILTGDLPVGIDYSMLGRDGR